jgi:surfeit locus 1 family protein
MSRRTLVFLVVALVLAAIFVRLGIWQLARLDERRARNRPIAERLAIPPAPLVEVLRDSSMARFRHVIVTGTFDYAHELVIGPRSHEGSPGVYLLTPLRTAKAGGETDTAILVNRGWVYAPDAMTVDQAKWRESDSATVAGYLDEYTSHADVGGPTVVATRASGVIRRMDHDSIAARLPYPLAPLYLVQLAGAPNIGTQSAGTPVRLDPPSLDEGPHRGYAMQWFAFAAIAVIGSVSVAVQERRRTQSRQRGPSYRR